MNSLDKYAEMTEDQQWRYVEGLEVNNELDNLNHEIKSKDVSEAQKRKDTPVFSGQRARLVRSNHDLVSLSFIRP